MRDKAGPPGGLQFKHGKWVFVPPDKLRASSSPQEAVPESQFGAFIPPVQALPAEGEAGVRGRGGKKGQYGGDDGRELRTSAKLSRFDFDREDDKVRAMRQKYQDEVTCVVVC